MSVANLKPRVFIGHGRSDAWKQIACYVSEELGLMVEDIKTGTRRRIFG